MAAKNKMQMLLSLNSIIINSYLHAGVLYCSHECFSLVLNSYPQIASLLRYYALFNFVNVYTIIILYHTAHAHP